MGQGGNSNYKVLNLFGGVLDRKLVSEGFGTECAGVCSRQAMYTYRAFVNSLKSAVLSVCGANLLLLLNWHASCCLVDLHLGHTCVISCNRSLKSICAHLVCATPLCAQGALKTSLLLRSGA